MPAYKEKNKDSWYVQFYYKDWTGKNKKKLKRGFQTKKEATEWERSFVMQQSCNLDMKFKDFWEVYKTDVKPQVKYNTWITKEYIVELKIMPYFKEKKINEITVRDILQWQNTLRSERDEKGNPYKGTYLKTINAQLSAIFNHAVRFYKLRVNPARQAGAIGTNDTEEMLFWTKDEYLLFIAEVANKAYTFYAFELLYWCGIRLGELLALTPADFDFENNVLSITKSFQKIKGEEYITPPKTKKSVRKVVMSKNVSVEMKNFIDSIYGIKDTDRIFTITKSYLHHEMNRGVKTVKTWNIGGVPSKITETYTETEEGIYTYVVWVYDVVGNYSSKTSNKIYIDHSNPMLTGLTKTETDWTNKAPEIDVSATDYLYGTTYNGSGIESIVIKDESGKEIKKGTSSVNYTVEDKYEGIHSFIRPYILH